MIVFESSFFNFLAKRSLRSEIYSKKCEEKPIFYLYSFITIQEILSLAQKSHFCKTHFLKNWKNAEFCQNLGLTCQIFYYKGRFHPNLSNFVSKCLKNAHQKAIKSKFYFFRQSWSKYLEQISQNSKITNFSKKLETRVFSDARENIVDFDFSKAIGL